MLTSITNISYGGGYDPFSIRAELIDDKLYIWINNFVGAPLKVVSGITQLTPGYVGIYTTSAQQKITAYKTHFDSSFDLVMTDPVPTGLGSVTAISNAGTLTAGTITWPTIAGPILSGTSIIRTFQATVTSCTDFITNIGYATVYGIANIQSQYVVTCPIVTPVMLLFFKGTRIDENAYLSWSTANEINNNYFLIERSLDGINFNRIAYVKGNGTSSSLSEYNFQDKNIPYGQLYYRLVQVDFDGKKNYSEIIELTKDKKAQLLVYPNPFTKEVTLQMFSNEKNCSFVVTNFLGQPVFHSDILKENEPYTFGKEFSPGLYFVRVNMPSGTEIIKINKE